MKNNSSYTVCEISTNNEWYCNTLSEAIRIAAEKASEDNGEYIIVDAEDNIVEYR